MTTLSEVPNLSKSLEKIKLILDMGTYLSENKVTITGNAILNAIQSKKYSSDKILRYVQEQAIDSFKTMSNCIGEELTTKILQTKL